MNNKTLIRGESLSINVKLDYDGIPFSEIDHGEIIANAWFQNNVKVPLIVTQLEGDGEFNLYSDIDTRKLRGESFLVNVIVKNLDGDAPDDLIMATFNQTFYIVNSATDMDNRPLPVGGGHSVVYLVDGEYYACQNYAEGETIVPAAAPTREGYTFSGWSTIPSVMPDHCIVVTGKMNLIVVYSQDLLYEDIDENTCRVIGRGECLDEVIAVPPTHEGKTVIEIGVSTAIGRQRSDPLNRYLYPFQNDRIIEKLIIPPTVKYIGRNAFYRATYLKEIVFSERENNEELRLSDGAFLYCGFEHLYIPSFVTPEWEYVYPNDNDNISASAGDSIFCHNESLVDVELEEGFKIRGKEAYSSYTGSNYYLSCGQSMFWHCSNLERISLPSTINSIGSRFFEYCKLGHITINGTLSYLGNYAFNLCYDENKKLKLTFTGRAPLWYHQDALYSYLHDGVHDVPIEITIEYDGTKAGWTAFRNNNWNLGSATLIWVDISQNQGD